MKILTLLFTLLTASAHAQHNLPRQIVLDLRAHENNPRNSEGGQTWTQEDELVVKNEKSQKLLHYFSTFSNSSCLSCVRSIRLKLPDLGRTMWKAEVKSMERVA